MRHYVTLEIAIQRRYREYLVEMIINDPQNEAANPSVRGHLHIDIETLADPGLEAKSYGQLLGSALFTDSKIGEIFRHAVHIASQRDGWALRIQLLIDPGASELQNLHWEALCDPQSGLSILANENILFSRVPLGSWSYFQPVKLRARDDLKALIVIANPTNLKDYRLVPIDVDAELKRAKASLGSGIRIGQLLSGDPVGPTVDNLISELRKSDGYDILYLVCHGALSEHHDDARLYLEGEDGKVDVVMGSNIAARIVDIYFEKWPKLVVLASCQTGGTGDQSSSEDQGALAAIGPRLGEAGIPAVVAMQGNVQMNTVEKFMPKFFEELQRDGQVDRAIAVARDAVRDAYDYWSPVLFMRLKSGRIWYTPGFSSDDFNYWPVLINNIVRDKCTPIIGSGALEALLGSTREIARRWAETFHFPMAPHEREDLPQVSQYLAVNQGQPSFPREKFEEYIHQQLLTRFGTILTEQDRKATLPDLLRVVGRVWRNQRRADPYKVLAGLPFSIYVTANVDNLLAEALEDVGRHPKVEYFRWSEALEKLPTIYDAQPDYRPDKDHPLVYHLFGHISNLDSIVLTEDDYFDYLNYIPLSKRGKPPVIGTALTQAALLFVGFQIEDWDFRVFFRSFMGKEGSELRKNYKHVAVQVDPESAQILEPTGARRYLEQYLQSDNISIYWGSTDDFIQELQARWERSSTPEGNS